MLHRAARVSKRNLPCAGQHEDMKTIIKNFLVLWRARAPREQVFLGGLAAFIVVALLAQGLWLAHSARSRLHQQIPQLRLQLANVQRQSGEIRQMQTQPASPLPQDGVALLAAATAAARSAGLTPSAAQMQLEGPRQVRLRATLPFDRWLEWVAILQRDARLRIAFCRIDVPVEVAGTAGSNVSGQTRIEALFVLPDPS